MQNWLKQKSFNESAGENMETIKLEMIYIHGKLNKILTLRGTEFAA